MENLDAFHFVPSVENPRPFVVGDTVRVARTPGDADTDIDTSQTYQITKIVFDEHNVARQAEICATAADSVFRPHVVPIEDVVLEKANGPMSLNELM